jgi:hypothetical protein
MVPARLVRLAVLVLTVLPVVMLAGAGESARNRR